MWTFNKALIILGLIAAIVSARADGIYNPSTNGNGIAGEGINNLGIGSGGSTTPCTGQGQLAFNAICTTVWAGH